MQNAFAAVEGDRRRESNHRGRYSFFPVLVQISRTSETGLAGPINSARSKVVKSPRMTISWFVEFENKLPKRRPGGSRCLDGRRRLDVGPYLDRMKVNYRVVIGNDAVTTNYGGVESLPQTVLVDREGRIALTHIGLTSKSNYEGEIAQLLGE